VAFVALVGTKSTARFWVTGNASPRMLGTPLAIFTH
jgi:hypothetical protein